MIVTWSVSASRQRESGQDVGSSALGGQPAQIVQRRTEHEIREGCGIDRAVELTHVARHAEAEGDDVGVDALEGGVLAQIGVRAVIGRIGRARLGQDGADGIRGTLDEG